MTPEQFEQLQSSMVSAVESQIKVVVNGKIDGLRNDFALYIKGDNEWKDQAQTTIDLGNNLRGFGKVVGYLIAIIGGITGMIAGVITLFKRLK